MTVCLNKTYYHPTRCRQTDRPIGRAVRNQNKVQELVCQFLTPSNYFASCSRLPATNLPKCIGVPVIASCNSRTRTRPPSSARILTLDVAFPTSESSHSLTPTLTPGSRFAPARPRSLTQTPGRGCATKLFPRHCYKLKYIDDGEPLLACLLRH